MTHDEKMVKDMVDCIEKMNIRQSVFAKLLGINYLLDIRKIIPEKLYVQGYNSFIIESIAKRKLVFTINKDKTSVKAVCYYLDNLDSDKNRHTEFIYTGVISKQSAFPNFVINTYIACFS